jgi:epoxyqueuosine reductase
VCPPNRREDRHGLEVAPERAQAWVPVLDLLASSDDELLARYGRWYIWQRNPRWVRRNALVVLGNIGDPTDPRVVDALTRALRDDDAILRAHAVWAAARLGRRDLLTLVCDDDDPLVRDELRAAEAA